MRLLSLLSKLAAVYLLSMPFLIATAFGQAGGPNEWTWVAGSNLSNHSGVYGTLQTPAAGNMPGSRHFASSWVDVKGNFWVFGGEGFDGYGQIGLLNDLWMFNPLTQQWSWMGGSNQLLTGGPLLGFYGTLGSFSPSNMPGGREYGSTWTDKNGNLWLFGGIVANTSYSGVGCNDLWEFDTTLNEWAWMGGSSTAAAAGQIPPGVYGALGLASTASMPGGRYGSSSWTDASGNFWLYGGFGEDSLSNYGVFNDLWEFQPKTLTWVWVGGSSTVDASGIYGSLGIQSPSNVPGGRFLATQWVDGSGNFWLFGGDGIATVGGRNGDLNDVWRYSPTANEWTWMGGNGTIPNATPGNGFTPAGIPGVYGVLGTPSLANIPGSRQAPVSWTDAQGNLWMLGGEGYEQGDLGFPDDLWVLNPIDDEWAWMNGASAGTQGGDVLPVYGTLGVSSAMNYPGSRSGGATWTDGSGNLWLFGGCALNSGGGQSCYDDVWRFSPAAPAGPPFFSLAATPDTVTVIQGPSVATSTSTIGLAVTGGFTGSVALTATGAPIGVSVSLSPASIAFPSTSTMTLTVDSSVAAGNYKINIAGRGGVLSQSTIVTINLTAPVAPVFSPDPGVYTSAQTVTITDTTPGATIYYTLDETTPTSGSTVYSGPILASSTTHLEAIAIAPGYANSPVSVATYTIGANSPLGEWAWIGGSQSPGSPGSYGVLGAPNASVLPASRSDAVHWTDGSGRFWLFGGSYNLSNIGEYNDLWSYTPSIGEWTWLGGSKPYTSVTCASDYGCGQSGSYGTIGTPGGRPGARSGSASWVDSSGNLWMFGGYGYDAQDQFGHLNDLWEYDPAKGQWTWMGGSDLEVLTPYSSKGNPGVYGTLGVAAAGNIPGSRYDAASWVDQQGNFWLFGGQGEDSIGANELLNDLWEYTPSTNLWTWMGGNNLVNILTGFTDGVYGTRGVPAMTNIPGSRSQAATWTDSSGNLWLFGGYTGHVYGPFNDLWKYSPAANEWTWVNGADAAYCKFDPLFNLGEQTVVCAPELGTFGTLGVPASSNVPPGGAGFGSWTDRNGNFWLFGGRTPDITGQNNGFYLGPIDSLWVYTPATNQWAWMSGDYAASNCSFVIVDPAGDQVDCDGFQGAFSPLGTYSSANSPPARATPASWTDSSGNLWLFSGLLYNTLDYPGPMNDLWEYQPSPTTLPSAAAPIFSLKPGKYFTGGSNSVGPLSFSNGMPNATIHYTTDGSMPNFTSLVYSTPLTISSTVTVRAFATAAGYRDSAVASGSYTFEGQAAAPTFSIAGGSYSGPQTVALSDDTAEATIYYTVDSSTPTSSSTIYTQPIAVSTSETVSAVARGRGYGVLDDIARLETDFSPISSGTYLIGTSKATPAVTATPALNSLTTAQALTVAVSVTGASSSPTPTGSISLAGGGYMSPVLTLTAGTGSIAIPAGVLAVGSDLLTVSYTPDASSSSSYTSSTGSATVTVTTAVNPSFAVNGTAVSIPAGATTGNTSSITLTSAGGFTGTVVLTAVVVTSPSGSTDLPTFSFGSTSPVTIGSSAVGNAILTIQTTAPTHAALFQGKSLRREPYTPGATLAVLLLVGVFKGYKVRGRRLGLGLVALFAFAAGSLIGCGSSTATTTVVPSDPGTSPGVYKLIVTGTSGSLSANSNVTLTVQ